MTSRAQDPRHQRPALRQRRHPPRPPGGYIQADIWVRYQRMRGNQVHYVCADDTHGTPVMLRAEKGPDPEQLIDRVWRAQPRFPRLRGLRQLPLHPQPRKPLVRRRHLHRLRDGARLIDTRSIEQFYDPVKKMFLPDRFIKGDARAAPPTSTATTARPAAPPTRPPTSRTPTRPSPAPSRCCAPPSTTSSACPTRAVEFLRGWTQGSTPDGSAACSRRPPTR
jgi:methionyl-tRNA synthetase